MNGAQNSKLVKAIMLSAAILSSGAATPAFAGTKQGQSTVAIVRPLSFFITDQLDFGKIFAGTTAGTVILAPTGVRTKTGGVTLVGNTQQVAVFAGQGSNNQNVDISMGANTINLTGPGAPMQVRTWVIGSTPTAILTTAPLRFRINSATGIFAFPLGATLAVGANQTPGTYTGTYSVTLQYQ
jgi:Domain of unknown function (DUF4402)